MIQAYIGLGSNLDTPVEQLQTAILALSQLPHSNLLDASHIYTSKAVGPGEQPDYCNAVARIDTRLAPQELLTELQRIEQQQGRQRGVKWGARTLDLDLLLYGDAVIATPTLTVPHPRLQERDFVLLPLREVSNTNLLLPDGAELDTLIHHCPDNGLVKTQRQLTVRSA